MNTRNTGQRRAAPGGELGANGEWYEGGKFIATRDNPKGEGHERKPAQSAASDEWARRKAAADAWAAPRLARFAALLADLEAQPYGFMRDMGYLLREQARLTPRQAEAVVRLHLGRRVKKNAAEWDALADALCEEFNGSAA